VSAISSIVVKMATKAGFVGKFSSHSLRIGGASAAVKGGLTVEQVKAIGGWVSGSWEDYLRSFSGDFSKKMGF